MSSKLTGMTQPLIPSRLRLLLLWTSALLLAQGRLSAGETWYILNVDNIEICSNASPRQLEQAHRELFYFNRSLELLFQRKLTRMDDPFHVLVLKNEKDMRVYYGENAEDTFGFIKGTPGFEISVVRADLPKDYSIASVLFHELTHNIIAPIDPPLWQNEGLAMVFGTIDAGKKRVRVGLVNDNYIGYTNYATHHHPIGFAEFFKVNPYSERYRNREMSLDFYAKAFLFAHYCWFGKPELRAAFLELGQLYQPSEPQFRELMGCDFDEMERRLKDYAKSGRYEFVEMDISKMPPLPPIQIREATQQEVMNFQARLFAVLRKTAQAEERLFLLPDDDLMVAETRWLVATQSKKYDTDEAMQKAINLGSTNPMMQAHYAWRLFNEFTEGKDPSTEPCLTDEQVGQILQLLRPALRAPGRFNKAVEVLVLVSDAAWLRNPPQIMEMIERWDRGRIGDLKDERTDAALTRVRLRAEGILAAR